MRTRNALVTGGTGAIGREICQTLANAGYSVAANCYPTDADGAREWIQGLNGSGESIRLVPFDAADFDDSGRGVEAAKELTGPIDVLINAAGITRDAILTKLEPENWSAVIRTNLDSVYNVTRRVIGGMAERGFGRVVNISSVNGQRGQFGQANYSAAKAGIHGFTMAVAREFARKGVTVNTVSPGYIESPLVMQVPEKVREKIREQIPVGRFGHPREIARAVLFLVDDASGFITGEDLSINGGFHMD